jgi:hypothetical protein
MSLVNLIEPQTRLGGVNFESATPFKGCDVNSNPLPSDNDIGVGGITALFPRCREPSGDGLDGGSLLLVQIPHGVVFRTVKFAKSNFVSIVTLDFPKQKPERLKDQISY